MALELKGKTTYKADRDIKAGEEVTIDQTFQADQEAVDQVVEGRVARARKERAEEIKKLQDDLTAAKAGGTESEKLLATITELKNKQAESDREAKLMRGLKKAGALDLEDEFLATIKVGAEDDDLAVEEKVKAAVKRRAELQKAWGAPAATKKPAGRMGGPVTEDSEPEDKKHADLLALVKRSKPTLGLARRLENITDRSEQTKIMESWKSQGLLDTTKK